MIDSKINIFVSYSHKNSSWVDKEDSFNLIPFLQDSLDYLEVNIWYDHDLKTLPGIEYERKINDEIDKADIVILLLSRDFINSKFIMNKELPRIRKKINKNNFEFIPILVEPWTVPDNHSAAWLIQTQIIPGNPTPLLNFTDSRRSFLKARNSILESLERTVTRVISSRENKKVNYKETKQIGEQKTSSIEQPNSGEKDNDNIKRIQSVPKSDVKVNPEIKRTNISNNFKIINDKDDSLKNTTVINKISESNSDQVLQMQASSQEVKWLYSNKFVFIEKSSNSFKKMGVGGEIIGATKPLKRNLIYVLTYHQGASFLLEFNLNTKLLVNIVKLPTVVKGGERSWGGNIIAATSDGAKVAMVIGFNQGIFLYNIKTKEPEIINFGSFTNYIAIDKNDEYYYLEFDNNHLQKISINTHKKEILNFNLGGATLPLSNNRSVFYGYTGMIMVFDFTLLEKSFIGNAGYGDIKSLKVTNDEERLYVLNVEKGAIFSKDIKDLNKEYDEFDLSNKWGKVYSMYLDDNDSVYVAFGNDSIPVMIEGGLSNPRTTHINIVEEKESVKINSIVENSSKKAILNNCYGYIVNSVYDIIPFDEIGTFNDCSGKNIEITEEPYHLDFIEETKVKIEFNSIEQIDFISDFIKIEKYSYHLYPKRKVNETFQKLSLKIANTNTEESDFYKKLYDPKARVFLPKLFYFKKDDNLRRIKSNDIKRIVFNTNEQNIKNIGVQIRGTFTYTNENQVSFNSIFPDRFEKDSKIYFINGTPLNDDSLPQEISYPFKSIRMIIIAKENIAFSKTDMDGQTFSIEYKKIDITLNNEDKFSHFIIANQSISAPAVIKGSNTKKLTFFTLGIRREVDICALKEIIFF